MKFGESLHRRSPEWSYYNLDYLYLKALIKANTTPGAGTAVSIPGQGAPIEREFGDAFFHVLREQHDRINLFVKSKSGEIERRLAYIAKQLAQFQARKPSRDSAALPAKTVEKYAKVDNDIATAGEEIRALSRFRAAQCTGFYKILKKYKRWTKDRTLERRFKDDVASSPDSFYQLHLGYLLDQYIDVLGTLRAALESTTSSSAQGHADTPSPASSMFTATETGSPADFDVARSTIPLGSRGSRAAYWVHPDHVVEVEILLLQQYMRLYNTRTGRSEDDVGLVVLDNAAAFSQRQNTSTIDEESPGAVPARAAGNAWWTSSNVATLAVGLDSIQGHESAKVAKVKRKHLEAFLNPAAPSRERIHSPPEACSHEQESPEGDQAAVRRWLAEHKDIKPIASICSRRTRFVGLHNGSGGGLWATLDRDIIVKESLPHELWKTEGRPEDPTGWAPFPHAVLEIRREGTQSVALINALDRSHLVERVRGFSIETHAVWTCCRPNAMLQPTWIPLLKQDIRKLPAPAARRSRKSTATTGPSSHLSPYQTSTSVTSVPSPYPSHTESTSASEFLDVPSLRDFRKKRRSHAEFASSDSYEAPKQQRYWNEYDNPESGDEEGYYIYIDPNASVKFPGQEMLEAWVRKTRELLRLGKGQEDAALLSSTEVGFSDDETVDTYVNGSPTGYGTMGSRGESGDIEALGTIRRNERMSLLGEIQARQHEREMTALQLYASCLGAGAVLDMILCILTITSRRKLRGEVDDVILFGVACNFLLLLVALTSVMSRKERLGWLHWGAVLLASVAMAVADALLLRWAL